MRQVVNHKLASLISAICVLGTVAAVASASAAPAAATTSHNGAGALLLLCLGGLLIAKAPKLWQ
jgi:hypothetical protein